MLIIASREKPKHFAAFVQLRTVLVLFQKRAVCTVRLPDHIPRSLYHLRYVSIYLPAYEPLTGSHVIFWVHSRCSCFGKSLIDSRWRFTTAVTMTRLGHQMPDTGINLGTAATPSCRYLFYLMNRKPGKAALRLSFSVFPYSNYFGFPYNSESI